MSNKANADIRQEMKDNKIMQWQIAHVLGVCEQTVMRWFRFPLEGEQREKILSAINQLKEAAVNG